MTKIKNFAGCYTIKRDGMPTVHIMKKHTYAHGNIWYTFSDDSKKDADNGFAGHLFHKDGKAVYGTSLGWTHTLKEAIQSTTHTATSS